MGSVSATNECFLIKWNNFQSKFVANFQELRNENDFYDVTLVCDDLQFIEAHKLILSASSPYFKAILKRSPQNQQTALLMPMGVQYSNLVQLIDFIYNGEIRVPSEDFPSFIKLVELLKIRGLSEAVKQQHDKQQNHDEHQQHFENQQHDEHQQRSQHQPHPQNQSHPKLPKHIQPPQPQKHQQPQENPELYQNVPEVIQNVNHNSELSSTSSIVSPTSPNDNHNDELIKDEPDFDDEVEFLDNISSGSFDEDLEEMEAHTFAPSTVFKFQCNHCRSVFNEKEEFVSHLMRAHKSTHQPRGAFTQNEEQESKQSQQSQHQKHQLKQQLTQCDICHRTYKTAKYMATHKLKMHNVEYTKKPVGRPRKIFRNETSIEEQIETTSSGLESLQVLSNQVFVSSAN